MKYKDLIIGKELCSGNTKYRLKGRPKKTHLGFGNFGYVADAICKLEQTLWESVEEYEERDWMPVWLLWRDPKSTDKWDYFSEYRGE